MSKDDFKKCVGDEGAGQKSFEIAAMGFSTFLKRFVRGVVYFVCAIMLVVQIRACMVKLMYPPISSKVSIVLNRTLWYPSLTICASTFNNFRKSALPAFTIAGPNGTTRGNFNSMAFWTHEFAWKGQDSLDAIYRDATWNLTDLVGMLQLNEKLDMIHETSFEDKPGHWVSRLTIRNGKCHTFIPDAPSEPEKSNAYEIHLRIPAGFQKEYLLFGWDIFLTDPGTEFVDEYGYFRPVNRISISSGDELQGTIALRTFKTKNTAQNPCIEDPDYVGARCGIDCLWEEMLSVAKQFGQGSAVCRFPWMAPSVPSSYSKLSSVPLCQNAAEADAVLQMLHRINTSRRLRQILAVGFGAGQNSSSSQAHHQFSFPRSLLESRCEKLCPRNCLTNRYEVSILSRSQYNTRENGAIAASIQLHYASNEIFEVEEYYGYEYSSFVGEIGGSLGLLIGASVMTFYEAFEVVVDMVSQCFGRWLARAF